MKTEIFKDIKGYEGLYQVSNLGSIKSLNYKRLGIVKLLKQQITRDGYSQIELSINKNRKKYYIHRLVAINFIEKIKDKLEVNHIDGNKLNNNIDNLEWSNRSENTRHCVEVLGKNCKNVGKYDLQGKLLDTYISIRQASKINKIDDGDISKICRGIRKTAGGFIWKFL